MGLAALLSLASLARAQGLGGSLGLATDDVFRGLSENNGQISPQVDLHGVIGQGYGGVSAEGVRRGNDKSLGAELIAYLGYQHRFGEDWISRATVRHYDYPGNSLRSRYHYDELGLSLGYRERLTLSAIASPDTYNHDYHGNYGRGAAFCYEIAVRQPLPRGLYGIAGLGYYDLRRQVGVGYAYWSAGLQQRWLSWVFDLRYVGTDGTARYHFDGDAGDRVLLSAFWLF
jgi:uncharacterized protein (TIGR02001 family)